MHRHILLIALLAALAAISGCATPVSVHETRRASPSKVGRTSAEIANSRALSYQDTIELIQNECHDMAKRRKQYMADAERYRRFAAKARFDKGLTSWERKAYFEMYRTIAADREDAAARYKELIQAYESRVSIISNRFNRQQASAIKFKNMKMAVPE